MPNLLKKLLIFILINLSAFGIPSLFVSDTLTIWGALGILSTLILLGLLLKYQYDKREYKKQLEDYHDRIYWEKRKIEDSWLPRWFHEKFIGIPIIIPPVKPTSWLIGSPTTIATYGTGVALSVAGKSAPAIMTIATKLPWGTGLAKLVGTGTGGAEIASGLATLGKMGGGGMGAGTVISATAPLVLSIALAWGVSKIIEKATE